jgi:hypothetical protein
MSSSLAEEKQTIRYMIEIYCMGRHGINYLCSDCVELLNYAETRLDRCPFGKSKVTCNKCKVHCYDGDHRDRIKEVMRYSGPRMIYRHPLAAVRHLKKEFEK